MAKKTAAVAAAKTEDAETRLAGGTGMVAAASTPEDRLRRIVMTCLLWEDAAYVSGAEIARQIQELVPQVSAKKVAEMAIEARKVQKLRHVPLLLAREMLRHDTHKGLVGALLPEIVLRADELTEFAAIYWRTGGKAKSLPQQAKIGLAAAFPRFNEYQLAKYDRSNDAVRLRDVLRLVHPTPQNDKQSDLWRRLSNVKSRPGKLIVPDTWEVAYSAAKNEQEKRAVWERLLDERKLGASALLKNLRNMQQVGVPRTTIVRAIETMNVEMILPLDFFKAAKHAPDLVRELENGMFRCLAEWPKLKGHTILVVDVSGSMNCGLAAKSEFNRMHAAAAMAVLAAEVCESVTIYVTAGSDMQRRHKTKKLPTYRGFGLADKITDSYSEMGGGGIFTRQALEYIRTQTSEKPERIAVFSDSQDMDDTSVPPNPFGRKNYIVDVAPHRHGVNFDGSWTAQISGWSPNFLRFIAGMEAPLFATEFPDRQ